MALRGRRQVGTDIRRELDLTRFRDALKDHRHWVSYGVVATIGKDDAPDDNDPAAVVIGPRGVMVDVVLLPAFEPVTCRYAGVQGGPSVTILAPIHPGDEVLVVLPDGELGLPPVIVAVMNSGAVNVPLEGDGRPVFRNDRLSVFSVDVPIEVRTPGGSVRVENDGTITATSPHVNLGAADLLEQIIKGNTFSQALGAFLAATEAFLAQMTIYVQGIQAIADPSNTQTPPMEAQIAAYSAAAGLFQGAAAQYLSAVTKTR